MSVYLTVEAVDTAPSVEDHATYTRIHDLTVEDPACIPLVLFSDTRRGLSDAISELLLCSGVAQPTVAEFRRRPQRRDEAPRLVVALRQHRRDIYVFGAEELDQADVYYLANICDLAGVDLYLLAQLRCRPSTRTAMHVAADKVLSRRDLAARLLSSTTRGARAEPRDCENALTLGAGVQPHCAHHTSAGQCAVSTFPDALSACRASPRQIMSRLHELTVTLDRDEMWAVTAAARDLYQFVERAVRDLGLSSAEQNLLRLCDVEEAGRQIRAGHRVVEVPIAMRPLVSNFVEVRVAGGGQPKDTLLIPRDDRALRRWSVPRRGLLAQVA